MWGAGRDVVCGMWWSPVLRCVRDLRFPLSAMLLCKRGCRHARERARPYLSLSFSIDVSGRARGALCSRRPRFACAYRRDAYDSPCFCFCPAYSMSDPNLVSTV